MNLEIVPATLRHVLRALAKVDPDLRELVHRRAGDLRRAAAKTFAESRSAEAYLVDGEVAAVFGVSGSALSSEVRVWLLVTPAAKRHAKLFVTHCRKEIQRLHGDDRRIVAYVEATYGPGLRFLRHWGFEIGPVEAGRRRAVLEPKGDARVVVPCFDSRTFLPCAAIQTPVLRSKGMGDRAI